MGSSGGGRVRKLSVVCLHYYAIVAKGHSPATAPFCIVLLPHCIELRYQNNTTTKT